MIEIGTQADHTWSSGLLKLLDMFDDEILMLVLDDYFLTEPVNWRDVESLLALMKFDDGVAKIDLTDDRLKVEHTPSFTWQSVDRLICSASNAPFQTSLQAALWRTDFLKRFLDASEDAWQFEKHGTRRVISARQHDTDRLILGTTDPPMRYANGVGGQGGKPGVIEARHMPAWMWEECVAKGWAHG